MSDRPHALPQTRLIEGSDAMVALGQELALVLSTGDVVLLNGDLGAGKTTLTQGIALALGISGPVTSPTFTLVSEHTLPVERAGIATLFHLDLYRIDHPEELASIGFDDYLAPSRAVTLIEWPERMGDWLPDDAIVIDIAYARDNARSVTIQRLDFTGRDETTP